MVNQDGILLERVGKTTNEEATAITQLDPDEEWKVVEE
jgi:hypothetical protein